MLQHQDSVHMFEQDACFVYAILSILVTMERQRKLPGSGRIFVQTHLAKGHRTTWILDP